MTGRTAGGLVELRAYIHETQRTRVEEQATGEHRTVSNMVRVLLDEALQAREAEMKRAGESSA